MYTKTKSDISFIEFLKLVSPVASFISTDKGNQYTVKSIVGTTMHFERKSTGKVWDMDLKAVHKAYIELKDFKTDNFKPYVFERHSPALGLLVKVGLLK